MAVPSYTTDLADINTAEVVTDWAELTGHTSGGAATQDGESYIQGSNCISQSTGTKTGIVCGLEYDYGSDMSASFSTGDCFFFWQIYLAAANVDTFVNGGLRIGVGSSLGNMNYWITGGKDFGKYPYGGWQNFAIDPNFTADYSDGTPVASTYQCFGSIPNILAAVAKGNPHGVDVIRYGRGDLIIEHGDVTNGYSTFAGAATQNDNQTNRWGLFQAEGTGYLWKGLISFGTTTNAVDFRDSNVNITIENTPRAYTAFNKIEIVNATSRVDWTGVNFTALNSSQLSLGSLEMINDATVNITGCVFTDMSTFIFDSNAVLKSSTWRRCGQVTQAGADIDDCIFDSSNVAVALNIDNLNNIDNCSFISDGSNHAMELNSTCAGNTYTLTGCTYTDYAATNGSTGNECIYNNSGGAVTINIDGGNIPTIRNGTSASTTVAVSYNHIITGLEQNTEVTYVTAGTSTELYHIENATVSDGDGKYKTTYAHSGGASVDIFIHHIEYKPDISNIIGITLPSTNTTVKVMMFEDENYYNPA